MMQTGSRRIMRGAVAGLVMLCAFGGSPAVAASSKPVGQLSIPALGVQSLIFAANWSVFVPHCLPSGGTTCGRASFEPVSVLKALDAASPLLFFESAKGTHIPQVEISVVIPGSSTPALYVLRDVTLGGVTLVPRDKSPLVMEQVVFHYGRITVTVGGTTRSWDVFNNSPTT